MHIEVEEVTPSHPSRQDSEPPGQAVTAVATNVGGVPVTLVLSAWIVTRHTIGKDGPIVRELGERRLQSYITAAYPFVLAPGERFENSVVTRDLRRFCTMPAREDPAKQVECIAADVTFRYDAGRTYTGRPVRFAWPELTPVHGTTIE